MEFLNAFRTWAFSFPVPQSPYTALLSILHDAYKLQALRIRVAQNSGPGFAWKRPLYSLPHGIPFGLTLTRALSALPSNRRIDLQNLKVLELDAFSDVEPLLRLTPNLERLRLELNGGFAPCINGELIDALKHVPRLRELMYTPESFRVSSSPLRDLETMLGAIIDDGHMDQGGQKDRSVELLKMIALRVPSLERLDLQRRWYMERDVILPANEEPINPEASRLSDHARYKHCANLVSFTFAGAICYSHALPELTAPRASSLSDECSSLCDHPLTVPSYSRVAVCQLLVHAPLRRANSRSWGGARRSLADGAALHQLSHFPMPLHVCIRPNSRPKSRRDRLHAPCDGTRSHRLLHLLQRP